MVHQASAPRGILVSSSTQETRSGAAHSEAFHSRYRPCEAIGTLAAPQGGGQLRGGLASEYSESHSANDATVSRTARAIDVPILDIFVRAASAGQGQVPALPAGPTSHPINAALDPVLKDRIAAILKCVDSHVLETARRERARVDEYVRLTQDTAPYDRIYSTVKQGLTSVAERHNALLEKRIELEAQQHRISRELQLVKEHTEVAVLVEKAIAQLPKQPRSSRRRMRGLSTNEDPLARTLRQVLTSPRDRTKTLLDSAAVSAKARIPRGIFALFKARENDTDFTRALDAIRAKVCSKEWELRDKDSPLYSSSLKQHHDRLHAKLEATSREMEALSVEEKALPWSFGYHHDLVKGLAWVTACTTLPTGLTPSLRKLEVHDREYLANRAFKVTMPFRFYNSPNFLTPAEQISYACAVLRQAGFSAEAGDSKPEAWCLAGRFKASDVGFDVTSPMLYGKNGLATIDAITNVLLEHGFGPKRTEVYPYLPDQVSHTETPLLSDAQRIAIVEKLQAAGRLTKSPDGEQTLFQGGVTRKTRAFSDATLVLALNELEASPMFPLEEALRKLTWISREDLLSHAESVDSMPLYRGHTHSLPYWNGSNRLGRAGLVFATPSINYAMAYTMTSSGASPTTTFHNPLPVIDGEYVGVLSVFKNNSNKLVGNFGLDDGKEWSTLPWQQIQDPETRISPFKNELIGAYIYHPQRGYALIPDSAAGELIRKALLPAAE